MGHARRQWSSMSSTLGSLGQVGVVLYDDIAQAHSARLRDTRATRKVGRLRARSGHHRGAPERNYAEFLLCEKGRIFQL